MCSPPMRSSRSEEFHAELHSSRFDERRLHLN